MLVLIGILWACIFPIFWQAGAKNPVVRLFIIDATYPEHVGPREVPVPAMIASRYGKLSCFPPYTEF